MEQKEVKIIVATHKQCDMPKDQMYLPLHVGAHGKIDANGAPLDFGFVKDNTGDNISEKNYCLGTQTGLYWMWKNLDADYLGLVHYRRFFTGKTVDRKDMLSNVLTYEQLQPMLNQYKVFVPKKRHYYIESIYSHYAHTTDGSHLDLTREIISQSSPEYIVAFDRVMNRTSAHMFNMMILKKELLNDYCSWLFNILFKLETGIDQTKMTAFEKRYGGRISERLFNVWLEYNLENGTIQKHEIKELPYAESVNWSKKVRGFLKAKFFNKKYSASF